MLCLGSMSFNERMVCDRETSTKTSSFYKLIASFQIIATLVLATSVLDLTIPVTESLQEKEIEIADSSPHIYTVGEFHDNYYSIILEIENKVKSVQNDVVGFHYFLR